MADGAKTLPDDELFDEDQSTEISLSDEREKHAHDVKEIQFSSSAPVISHHADIAPAHRKDAEELLEEQGGDDFVISIRVSDPIKVGDGMSAYMAYSVTTSTTIPSFKSSEFSVKRRFSDFLGLHERLHEKHLLNGRIIPPPPDKSVVGMVKVKGSKEDQSSTDFVERRQHQLESFLNRVARHKELRQDVDFKEFLEADELPRAKNTAALSKGGLTRLAKTVGDAVSKMTSKMTESDPWFEEKQNQVEALDQQLRKLHLATEQLVILRRETSVNTASFAKSLSLLSNTEEHTGLSRALSHLAELEEKVEHIQQEQATYEFYDLTEALKEYIGLITAVKAVFQQRAKVWNNWQSSQATLTKKREALVKLELAGKSDKIPPIQEEVKEWERRVEKGEEEFDLISKTVKKEIAIFEKSRICDFRNLIVKYLESLLKVQEQLVKLWEAFQPEARDIN